VLNVADALQSLHVNEPYGPLYLDGKRLRMIGSGCSRTVFELPGSDVVLKLQHGGSLFDDYLPDNVAEWALWHTYLSKRAAKFRSMFAATYQLVLLPAIERPKVERLAGRCLYPTVVVQERVNDGGQACKALRNSLDRNTTWGPVSALGWALDFHGEQFVYSAADHQWKYVDYACYLEERLPVRVQAKLKRMCGHEAVVGKVRTGEKPLVIGGVDDLRIMLIRS